MIRYRIVAVLMLITGCSYIAAQGRPPVVIVTAAMSIGQATQPAGSTTVTVPVTLSLGATDTSFTSFSLTVDELLALDTVSHSIAPSIPPYTGPWPGKSVTVNCTFTAVSGQRYRFTGEMSYKDGSSPPKAATAQADRVYYTAK
jgi:hypothetical protein